MEIFESYDVIQFEEGPAKVCRAWVGGEELRRVELDQLTAGTLDYYSASDLNMLRDPEAHPLYNPEH